MQSSSTARRSARSPTSRSNSSKFRRTGRHRHRERAAAKRAAQVSAAADRDRRRAQGHQPLSLRPKGRSGGPDRECNAALRGHARTYSSVQRRISQFRRSRLAWPYRRFLGSSSLSVPAQAPLQDRAAAEHRTVHVHDVLQEPGYVLAELVKQQDYRTVLAVPILRGAALLGVIAILRPMLSRLPTSRSTWSKTFADQAVIAIENCRDLPQRIARVVPAANRDRRRA